MDVSAEYFKSTGDFMDDSQQAISLEEINKIAPSNVTTLDGVDAGIPTGHSDVILDVIEPSRTQEHWHSRQHHLRGQNSFHYPLLLCAHTYLG